MENGTVKTMRNNLKLKGHLKVYKNKELVLDVPNLIVDAGKAEVAKLIGAGLGGTSFSHIAIGSGTTAAASTDTALEVEVARMTATITNITTTITNDTVRFEATYNATAAVTITEYGIFNAATGGTMLSRRVENAINLNNGDSLTILWDIQVL